MLPAGIGAGFIPKSLDLSVVDKVAQVTNEESIAMALRLAKKISTPAKPSWWFCQT